MFLGCFAKNFWKKRRGIKIIELKRWDYRSNQRCCVALRGLYLQDSVAWQSHVRDLFNCVERTMRRIIVRIGVWLIHYVTNLVKRWLPGIREKYFLRTIVRWAFYYRIYSRFRYEYNVWKLISFECSPRNLIKIFIRDMNSLNNSRFTSLRDKLNREFFRIKKIEK